MREIIILILLAANYIVCYSQDDVNYKVELSILDRANTDSIAIIEISIVNNSDLPITVHNPVPYSLNSMYYPVTWEMRIIGENEELCVDRDYLVRVSWRIGDEKKFTANFMKEIKAYQSRSFQIPINLKRMLCTSEPDFKENPFRKGRFKVHLKIILVKPQNIVIESNEAEFIME